MTMLSSPLPILAMCATMTMTPALAQNAAGGTAEPFTIDVLQDVLDDLKMRLKRARIPAGVEDVGWGYGTDLDYLTDLVAYWADGYDWRVHEARLNELPQFRAAIDSGMGETIGIHFVHVLGNPREGEEAIPLLLLHGWPSSFVQFEKIIPLLADPQAHGLDGPAFDVVAPSLVGYGFSDAATRPGMSVGAMAPMMHALMTDVLGYDRYGMRSSDLGAGIAGQMVLKFPDAIIGSHTGGTNPFLFYVPDDLSDEETAFVEAAQAWGQAEMAYAQEHSTKPQTVAVALNDSPAGLASWIVEKFWRWSDIADDAGDRDLSRAFTRDELLTNATIYWVNGAIGPSMRLYLENARDPGEQGQLQVPVGHLMSSKDMFETPRSWIERFNRVDHYTPIDQGGHFLEWEVPEVVAADLMAFFGDVQGDRQ